MSLIVSHCPTLTQNVLDPYFLHHLTPLPFSVDPLEISKSNSVIFKWNDSNAYLNTRRIFLEFTFYATDEKNLALKASDYISATNVASHACIDSVHVNIGRYLTFAFQHRTPPQIGETYIEHLPMVIHLLCRRMQSRR